MTFEQKKRARKSSRTYVPLDGLLRPAPRIQNICLFALDVEEAKRQKRYDSAGTNFEKKKKKAEEFKGRKRPAAEAT